MAKAKFTVGCMAVYTSELEIPDEIATDKNAVVRYIRDHLPDCNVNDLQWVDDMEPEAAVSESDIIYIDETQHETRFGGQFRATDIKWDTDEADKKDLVNTLPSTVIIPDEYIVNGYASEDDIGNWLSDEYGFLHNGYTIVYLTENGLKSEEEYLKRNILDAGVDAVEEFLGHPLDDDKIDIEGEMDDVLTQIPDEEYIKYLQKYKIIQ